MNKSILQKSLMMLMVLILLTTAVHYPAIALCPAVNGYAVEQCSIANYSVAEHCPIANDSFATGRILYDYSGSDEHLSFNFKNTGSGNISAKAISNQGLAAGMAMAAQTNLSSAAAYALIEQSSGKIIKAGNTDSHLPMASTTKTMTALVVLEHCTREEMVSVPDEAVGTEGSSMYLKYNEIISVEDLLYGLMLLSGNDAAIALAVHVGGSVEGFVEIMNARAEEMGLKDTHFVTPNGLHDNEHYTTALELARIGAEALKNELFRKIVSTQYHTSSTGSVTRTMKNKNAMLWDYEGAIGVKTGYTMAAGRCLLFAAERDGMTLVGAVLNCRPMFEAAAELLDYGFANYSICKAVEAGSELASCYVPNAQKSLLALLAKRDIIVPVPKGEELELTIKVSLIENVQAPIIAGEVLGSAELYYKNECLGSTPLIAANAVPSRDFLFYLRLLLRSMQC